jgi:rubrerythrin
MKSAEARETNATETKELLLQAVETETGGIQIYQTAIQCAVNEELRKEWEEYLEQTEHHEEVLRELCGKLGLDPDEETPGRSVVKHLGESLVGAMSMARKAGDPNAAQIVAAECVVLAETKDHQNWELIGELAKSSSGEQKKLLQQAYEEIEEEEDEHYYHTKGWTRELWIEALGMPAVLPPPEEEKDVKTAIGAARAKKARKQML